jgi:DNA-binding SARP family transcriptional activator
VTRKTRESTIGRLAARVASGDPRVIVLAAPAGYGKGSFLRDYATRVGPLLTCTLPEPGKGDASRVILDALVAEDTHRVRRSAADRLAQRTESASSNSRAALRREWPVPGGGQLFVLRDVAGALSTPAGADLFAELVAALPEGRVLAISARAALAPALAQIAARADATALTAAELALTPEATVEVALDAGLPVGDGAAIYGLAGGWPLVSRLIARLLHEGEQLVELAEAVELLDAPAVLGFVAHRTVARLDDVTRDALIVTTLLREASHRDLIRILGDAYDDLGFARLAGLPFVMSAGDRIAVHPEVGAMLDARFAHLFTALYERTLGALTGDGRYVDAAQIALERGDVARAASIIDAAPSYTDAVVPLAEYERIIDRLDRKVLTRYPNLWIATIPYRSYAVDRTTHLHEAETVYYCLPSRSTPEQRALALMPLASAYWNVGRLGEVRRLLTEALEGFARESPSARASLLNFTAWLDGMDGRFARARELASEASSLAHAAFAENQTLHYIDMHEAAYRGQHDRLLAIVDESLRRTDDLPAFRANVALNGALFAWVNGDDEAFFRYVSIIETTLTPGLERGFAPVVDAARGLTIDTNDEYVWPVIRAVAQLFRLGNAPDATAALDAARQAAHGADGRGDPYTQILAYAALHVLQTGAARAEAGAKLAAVVAPVEGDEMRAAVGALLKGGPAGILELFVRRRVLRERSDATPSRFVVELLAGRVTRDGAAVRLSDKEFELLALLGSTHGPVSRDRIGEALWDHLDPEEWPNNLKVTLSRLRSKLGMRDAVMATDARYSLSPLIDVDLRRAETLVRECAAERLDDTKRRELESILTAFASGGVDRYDRFTWVQPLQARMNDLLCRAGAVLAGDALAGERWSEALRYAADVTAIDALNEDACTTTLRVLLERGDVDAARREFRRYAASLAHELGATPSQHLAELVRAGPVAEHRRR